MRRASLPAPRPEPIAALAAYAKNLGLAFQIVDDLLDVEGDPAQTGKAVREDARKTTFVSFSGVDGARQLAAELCETADRALGRSARAPTGCASCRRSSRRGACDAAGARSSGPRP